MDDLNAALPESVESGSSDVATDSVTIGNTTTITLTAYSNLTLRILHSEDDANPGHVVLFLVERQCVENASPVMKAMLSGAFAEARADQPTLEGTSVAAAEVLLRVLHNKPNKRTYEYSLKIVWEVLLLCDYREVPTISMKEWFAGWHDRQVTGEKLPLPRRKDEKVDYYRRLLSPCWFFDHAKGFAVASNYIIYNSAAKFVGLNPHDEACTALRLPGRVMRAGDAARGGLRNYIVRGLFDSMNATFRKASCSCVDKTSGGYCKEMCKIGVWPCEQSFNRTAITTLCERLEKFRWTPNTDSCAACRLPYRQLLTNTVRNVNAYFNGLCLDCIDHKPGHIDDDHDHDYYFNGYDHVDISIGSWCRVVHSQSSYYYSSFAREETDKERLKYGTRGSRRGVAIKNGHG